MALAVVLTECDSLWALYRQGMYECINYMMLKEIYLFFILMVKRGQPVQCGTVHSSEHVYILVTARVGAI